MSNARFPNIIQHAVSLGRFLSWGTAACTMLTALPSAKAQAPNGWSENDVVAVSRCVGFMLLGPQYNGIKIAGEGFNCKPVGDLVIRNGIIEFSGQLSHQLTARPDDQYNFTIRIAQDGKIHSVTGRTNEGGFTAVLTPESSGTYGARLTGATLNLWGVNLARAVMRDEAKENSDWMRTMDAPVLTVVYEVARSIRSSDTGPQYFHDRPGGDLSKFDMIDGRNYSGAHVDSRFPLTYISACEASCNANGQCKAWTILRAKGSRKNHVCYLKGDGTTPQLNRDAVSGVKPPQFVRRLNVRP